MARGRERRRHLLGTRHELERDVERESEREREREREKERGA